MASKRICYYVIQRTSWLWQYWLHPCLQDFSGEEKEKVQEWSSEDAPLSLPAKAWNFSKFCKIQFHPFDIVAFIRIHLHNKGDNFGVYCCLSGCNWILTSQAQRYPSRYCHFEDIFNSSNAIFHSSNATQISCCFHYLECGCVSTNPSKKSTPFW